MFLKSICSKSCSEQRANGGGPTRCGTVSGAGWLADRVISVLTGLIAQHGTPVYLRSDNGAEFVATAVQTWRAQSGIQTLYIDPRKPWQTGKEERFNGIACDECLNMHVFGSLAEACERLGLFRHQYNTERPHSQLGYLTPLAFKAA